MHFHALRKVFYQQLTAVIKRWFYWFCHVTVGFASLTHGWDTVALTGLISMRVAVVEGMDAELLLDFLQRERRLGCERDGDVRLGGHEEEVVGETGIRIR